MLLLLVLESVFPALVVVYYFPLSFAVKLVLSLNRIFAFLDVYHADHWPLEEFSQNLLGPKSDFSNDPSFLAKHDAHLDFALDVNVEVDSQLSAEFGHPSFDLDPDLVWQLFEVLLHDCLL